MHLSCKERPWGKSFTFKRYLHPPLAENIVSVWPSSMVLTGEIQGGENSQVSYGGRWNESALPSAAVIFTVNGEFLPYRKVKYNKRSDGVPVHSFLHNLNGLIYREETFCEVCRRPAVYVKITLTNSGENSKVFDLGVLMRKGAEFDLVGCISPDGYYKTEQDKDLWLKIKPPTVERGVLVCGKYRMFFSEKDFGKKKHGDDISSEVSLEKGQSKTFYFVFSSNNKIYKADAKNYRAAKNIAEDFWRKELKKAKFVPDNKKLLPLFYNLLAGELQMFCYPSDCGYVLLRQGGLQRYVWPGEAVEVFDALSRVGGYEDYLLKALDTYFSVMQVKDGPDSGKIKTFGIDWAANGGAVIESFCHLAKNDGKIFDKYINNVIKIFEWVERKRKGTYGKEGLIGGLFPVARSCDCDVESQIWGITDNWYLKSYDALTRVMKQYNHPLYEKTEKAFLNYYKIMRDNFYRVVNIHAQLGERQTETMNGFIYDEAPFKSVIMPTDACGEPKKEEVIRKQFIFQPVYQNYFFLYNGFAGYGTPLAKALIKPFEKYSEKGLIYPIYASASGEGYTWYVTSAEFFAYFYYKNAGDRKAQEKILRSQLKYAVTGEYYTCERYDDHDAFVVPWLPNASANGRIIHMILDFYGKNKNL